MKKKIYLGMMICGTIGMIIFLLLNIEVVKGDAQGYLELSNSFLDENGKFMLANYEKSIRGIVFPLLIFFNRCLANILTLDISIVNTCINFIVFGVATFCIVKIFSNTKERNVFSHLKNTFFIVALFVIFAKYSFTTILSDLPALCVLIFTMYFIYMALEKQKCRIVYMFFAGVFAYMTYNIRTIYLFSIIIILILVIFYFWKSKDISIIVGLASMFLGMFIMAIPQMIVNYNNFQIFSMQVITSNELDEVGLFVRQLFWGIDTSMYVTYANNTIEPLPTFGGFHFIWGGAQLILDSVEEISLSEYFRLVITYPLHFMAIFITHLINMISPYFNQVYIMDLMCVKWPYLFFMYTICYITIWDIYNKFKMGVYKINNFVNIKVLFSYVLIIPVLAISLGAVEQRFSIPLLLLIFYYFIVQSDLKKLWSDFKNNLIGNLAIYLLLLVIMINFWITTLSSGPIILSL